jgi:hypothetical protein
LKVLNFILPFGRIQLFAELLALHLSEANATLEPCTGSFGALDFKLRLVLASPSFSQGPLRFDGYCATTLGHIAQSLDFNALRGVGLAIGSYQSFPFGGHTKHHAASFCLIIGKT